MSETKHTPGPWKYEEATKTIRSGRENYWLCTMDSWDGAVNHEANAKLIAAAPELLEAAKDLITALETQMPRFKNYQQNQKLHTAIRKAEGR